MEGENEKVEGQGKRERHKDSYMKTKAWGKVAHDSSTSEES